jgi:hypothetical protein
MAHSIVAESVGFRPLTVGSTLKADSIVAVITLAIMACAVSLALWRMTPPVAVAASAPLTEFSSARAMQYVKVIAQKPHPTGSLNHGEVRAFILKELTGMGFEPEVQKTTVINQNMGLPLPVATVSNIVAQLKGTNDGKALLIVSHYDSVPTSPGANDDGAGVAAMLETARALKASPPLKNDVIFLFTDAEEWGLLGAQAFVDEHPLAKKVGLVINLEARGNGGPSIMFETSPQNGQLISEFAKAAPYPFASSLYQEAYKRLLPNDTDLSIFKKAGFAGLNLAYINGPTHVHSALDNLEQMDEGSLQHHGSYTLSLSRHFGNLDLENIKSGDAVYFDLFGSVLVHYSTTWVKPIAILCLLLFAGVLVLGHRRKLLSLRGMAFGFAALFINILLVTAAVSVLWLMIRAFHPEYMTLPLGEIYDSNLYVGSFVALAILITSALYIFFRNRSSVQNLTAGALLWFMLLTIITSLFVPGASYLFALPVLCGSLALGITFVLPQGRPISAMNSVMLTLLAVPAIVLFTPLIYIIFVGLTLRLSGVVIAMVTLLLGLLIPQLSALARPKKWLLPIGAALACLGFIITGSVISVYSKERPKPNNIFYVMNASSNKAIWASYDAEPDAWTSQFLTNAQKGALTEYLPSTNPNLISNEAPVIPVPPPNIDKLEESAANGVRTLRLRVTSPRQAPIVMVFISSGAEFEVTTFNGQQLVKRPRKQWGTSYYGFPPEGFEITLETQSTEPLNLKVVDITYELPNLTGKPIAPRPSNMIASRPYSDSTLISKSFVF